MSGKPPKLSPPQRPGPPAPAFSGQPGTVQQSRAFSALPKPKAGPKRDATIDELVSTAGGAFQMRDPEHHVMRAPNGVFNFVRVQGATRNQASTYISSRAPHAMLAGGHPVLYAGTASFDAGKLAWWSNYSGTYQPNAEFNRQAALPPDKFVPWQRLQMGGVGLQRGMLADHRKAAQPEAPKREAAKPQPAQSQPAKAEAKPAARAEAKPAGKSG